jgi:hypothetical protein
VARCACAWIEGSALVHVEYVPPELARQIDGVKLIGQVVVERPEYQGARSDAARVEDLMALSWAGAQAAYSIGAPVIEVSPRRWKGTEAKPPHHMRLLDVLTPAELKLFPAETRKRVVAAAERYALSPGKYPSAKAYGKWDGHNLLDAAALGLWHVGRFR